MTYRFASSQSAYTLVWPRTVLRSELEWLLRSAGSLDTGAAELLLEEAFTSDEPRDELRSVGTARGFDPAGPSQADMLRQLLVVVDRLPELARPRPYWHQRQGLQRRLPDTPSEQQPAHRLQVAWAHAVHRFFDSGYLGKAAPTPCVDDGDERPQDDVLEEQLARLLDIPGLWPLQPETWDKGTFYSLVEAVGDLIARPRSRWWHDYARCGWHYDRFATTPGQALYRAEVNDLLDRAGAGLQLAGEGEDVGRLVRVAGDDREELLHRALATPDATDRDAVRHATAVFRARTAGREEKRSGVVALARVLEDRRSLLKAALLRKDEGVLFDLANNFDLRHRAGKQYADYDEAFLEWIFWWYLATLELTNRLLTRQDGSAGEPA